MANSPVISREFNDTDLMRNDIGRVAAVRSRGLWSVPGGPSSGQHHHRLPMTLHASDLLRAAFPAASIIGAPKVGDGDYR